MNFFSLPSLIRQAGETFKRFPLTLLSAAVGTVVVLMINHNDFPFGENNDLIRLGMTSYLSFLMTISVTLYTERFTFSRAKKYAAWFFSIAIAVLYYFSLPHDVDELSSIRLSLFSQGLLLLVSFSPFLLHGEMNGMWQFNKSLFIRILTSAIYSAVLFAGLALAMLAVDKLFEVSIKDKYYFDLWVVIAGIFNTWFFLSGVPENIPSLNDETGYPKGLKIFTMYILLPLITIFMIILYLYAGKIIITGNWPVGWVGYMVIAFAIFGILSFLLIYPLRDDETNPWVKFYSRLFYFLLIVPIVLLFTAIYKRISQYGVTEERYFVLILAFWLSFITVYFIVTNGKNIRMIPLSLCLVVFLSSFGPWGAFSVSHNSQFNELTTLLDSNHVLLNGKVDTTKTHDVKSKDYERIKDITLYINRMHGHDKLKSYFYEDLDTLREATPGSRLSKRADSYKILDLFRLNRIDSGDEDNQYLNFNLDNKIMRQATGYDFVKEFTIYNRDEDFSEDFFIEADSVHMVYSGETGQITLSVKNVDPLVMELQAMLDSLPLTDNSFTPQSRLTLEADNRQWRSKIIFSSVSVTNDKSKRSLNTASGMLMLRMNNREENEVGEKGTK